MIPLDLRRLTTAVRIKSGFRKVRKSVQSSCTEVPQRTGGSVRSEIRRNLRKCSMIVSEVMTTRLVTVTPHDTLSHAANLLRQHQFHHLPVVRDARSRVPWGADRPARNSLPVLEGLLTSQDIDLAAAAGTESPGDAEHSPWDEGSVAEVMHRSIIRVTPTTSVAAAAQILVERGLNCLPVVEYERSEKSSGEREDEALTRPLLVG